MNRIKLLIAAAGIALIPAFVFGAGTKKLPDYQINLHGETLTSRPRAQDDFYEYVNYDWFHSTTLSADKIRYGSFDIVQDVVDTQISDITTDAIAHTKAGTASPYEKNVAALYESITDRKSREAAGLGKLSEYIKQIEQVKTVQEYAEVNARLCSQIGSCGMIGDFGIGKNPQDAKRYVVYMGTPHILKSREFAENPANKQSFDIIRNHIADVLILYGRTPADAQKSAGAIFDLLKDLAVHSLPNYESMNPVHKEKLTITDMRKLYTSVDIDKVLTAGGIGPSKDIKEWFISDRELIAYFNSLNTEANLPLIKELTVYEMLDGYSHYLSPAYEKLSLKFSSDLLGLEPKTEEKRDQELCTSIANDIYQRLYAQRYYNAETEKRIKSYVSQVIAQYRKDLTAIDWMEPATKKRALKKLSKIAVHVGYSRNYHHVIDKINFRAPSEGGSLIDNVLGQNSLTCAYQRSLVNKPVDHTIYNFSPIDVNASYNPEENSINFSMAILQKPFFDKDADDITNLGAIGSVIAHEITHCFDSLGSLYDENGAVSDWWTEKDKAEFTARQQVFIEYFSRYHLSDGTYLNGANTLGENIADVGGVACITKIAGDDPVTLRKLYTAYAALWKELGSDQFYRILMENDVHSISAVRIDGVLSNISGFYTAFDVKPGDAMYVAPEDRVKLW